MDTKDKTRILERQKLAYQGMQYSIQRIDLLVIALCGGGVYLCLETIKFLNQTSVPLLPVKLAGALFLFGIVTNMIGQWCGKKANEHDFCWCETRLDGDPLKKQRYHDRKADHFSKLARRWDTTSMIITGGGLITIVVFFCFTF